MSDLGINAAKAYGSAASAVTNALKTDETTDPAAGFGKMLNSAIGSLSQASASAEGAITNASMGRGDLVDVVTAVAAAESTLETVVAVRDEVIKAYQDIMRMPI